MGNVAQIGRKHSLSAMNGGASIVRTHNLAVQFQNTMLLVSGYRECMKMLVTLANATRQRN